MNNNYFALAPTGKGGISKERQHPVAYQKSKQKTKSSF